MRRKRFNAHARMLPSPRFSVASAFVPHLCFLSLLCYVRILLATFHCPFSLFARSPLLFCFSDFPHLLCYLCFFRISLFSLRPLSLCFLSLLCFLSDFPISPDSPVRAKTFSTHNKSKNSYNVRRKRFNTHARMLPSPRFLLPLHLSLISAFSLYSVFSPISLFPQTLSCALKRFSLTTSRKMNCTPKVGHKTDYYERV